MEIQVNVGIVAEPGPGPQEAGAAGAWEPSVWTEWDDRCHRCHQGQRLQRGHQPLAHQEATPQDPPRALYDCLYRGMAFGPMAFSAAQAGQKGYRHRAKINKIYETGQGSLVEDGKQSKTMFPLTMICLKRASTPWEALSTMVKWTIPLSCWKLCGGNQEAIAYFLQVLPGTDQIIGPGEDWPQVRQHHFQV